MSLQPATPLPVAPLVISPADPLGPLPAAPRRPRQVMAPGAPSGFTPGGPTWRAPVLGPRTPEVDSPEWHREQIDTERRERDLNRTLRGICRGC